MTPAQRYAAKFGVWRQRMPMQMRLDGTRYWLMCAGHKPSTLRAGASANRGMGLTRYEKASSAAYSRMIAAGHRA